MPTDLPRPKRKRSPRNLAVAIPTHPVLSGLLNAFMIATVLVLFALVLLQGGFKFRSEHPRFDRIV